MKEEYLFGITPVFSCLIANNRDCHTLFVKKNASSEKIGEIIALAKKKGIPFKETDQQELEKFTLSGNHQGVVLLCSPLPTWDIHRLLKHTRKKEHSLVIAMDQIQDPQNLGAIIRTAAFFGADGVITPQRRSSPLSPVVSKASAGAMESFPIILVNNLVQTLQTLKRESYFVFGSTLENARDFRSFPAPEKLVLVLGSEGSGMRNLVGKTCDALLKIEGANAVQSLNVNAAASILIHHFSSSQH